MILLCPAQGPWASRFDSALDLYRITRGLHGTFATDGVCQQGRLAILGTWFYPFFILAYAQIVETNFPKLALSFRPSTSNIPLYFLDLLWIFAFFPLLDFIRTFDVVDVHEERRATSNDCAWDVLKASLEFKEHNVVETRTWGPFIPTCQFNVLTISEVTGVLTTLADVYFGFLSLVLRTSQRTDIPVIMRCCHSLFI